MVKRLSRILDMDESAVQLCAELPFFGSVVKRLSHILHMDGSTVQLCPELPILTIFCSIQNSTRAQNSNILILSKLANNLIRFAAIVV